MLAALALFFATAAPLAEVHSLDEVMRTFPESAHIRVVNVWATWCAPCVAEIGDVQKISEAFHKNEVEVVGVSLDDAIPGDRTATKEKVQRFLAERKIHYRNLYYVGPTDALASQARFDGTIPITLVYDASGREIARNEGKLDVAWFQRTLAELVRTSNRGGKK
jgi:thiol-disulfide isomerase/thioredoxin